MNRTTFALAASLIVSSFAMEAAAGRDYHHKRDHYNQSRHYDKHDHRQRQRYNQQRHSRGNDRHANCINPSWLDNDELQRMRAKHPGKDICYGQN